MDSQKSEVNVYSSNRLSQISTSSPSTVSVSSPISSGVTLDNYQQPSCSNSQFSDATTITLSSPSQALEISSQETLDSFEAVEKECQTSDGVFLSKYEYENLMKKASFCPDFQNDLMKIKSFVSNMPNPEMDPKAFEQMCKNVGAHNMYNCIRDAICSEKMSDERKQLSEVRTMVIIYIMVYSKSQKSNSFQVALSRILLQFGISQQGLESLKNLGIAAHPETIRLNVAQSSSSTANHVLTFVKSAIKNNHFRIFCIDDYHNIHTMHRPETKTQTKPIHMATLLLKVFPNIKAVAHHGQSALPAEPVQIKELQNFKKGNLNILSKTFAENMPDWVIAKYFDPETERHRLLAHNYQQTDIYHTRCMENTKLVDSIQLSLKSRNDVLTALQKMLASGLEVYLSNFIAPFMGDWPMQYFIRQLVYSNTASIPATIKNVIPFLGPLHISLNARECVVLNFQEVFSDLYTFLFGNKAKLAKKPRPWRISFLLEVIYGGWTLIRDAILSAFHKCKDIEFLTLLNLIDNYVPLVLSIYSIVFKCNQYELFCHSLLQCWVMCVVFRRRHYNKALLALLSTFLHLEENHHALYDTLRKHLIAFDEYPVENFHSLLRRRTKDTDNANVIASKAKEIDNCKHQLHSFQSAFVPPRHQNFSQKHIDTLKTKAAEFLALKFELVYNNPNKAVQQPRTKRQPKHITKWKLPNIFGEKIVTNQVLSLGFTSVNSQPHPNR